MGQGTRRLVAEGLGSALLFACVVGSGIMAEALAGGNVAIALLGNTLATGAILYVLITIFGPISGAHFNPAVTLVMRLRGEIATREALAFVVVQLAGGIIGIWLTHLMFDLPILQYSTKARRDRQLDRRIRRHLRVAADDPGRGAIPSGQCACGGRVVYRGGILVHQFDQLCQPGDCGRAVLVQQLCGNCPARCAAVHRVAAGRRARGLCGGAGAVCG